jgi:hypothetical protein
MLPRMAEADPGPWFTARVLRATVYAPRRSATHWRATWIQLLHRPRIALEAAYVGTAMGLLGLALPMPAFLPAPGDLVQTLSPAPLVAPLKAPAQRVLGQFAAAERRTATHLQQGLGLAASPAAGSVPAGTIWKRGTLRVRGWFHGLRRPPAEKAAPPTNS